ncbi:MAG TPA: M12 family metallo-peptidase [Thermoanaerobaculia bacterium]|nr:M12 family metallo-peptidase [Thermoanaerobaculia bacterium]
MAKLWIRCLGLVSSLALLATAAHAAPAGNALFSPVDAVELQGKALNLDTSYQALAQDPASASLLVVRANPDAVSEAAESITLNLGAGLDLRAHRVEARRADAGILVWSGVLEYTGDARVPFSRQALQFDPINSVLLVNNGGRITGNVHYNGEWYKIRPLNSGDHAIVAVDFSAMPPDHPAEYGQLRTIRMPNRPASLTKADTVIRVMVNYTPAAAAASGDINGLITLAVAEANLGYDNSGVLIDIILANKSQTTYTESGSFSTDLSRYRSTTDTYMTAIHTTRNSSTADVAVLLINNASSCGLASGIGSTASTAFAVAHWDCATGYYSFAHEIGHLQSARHDPATDSSTSPYTYGHGYRYTGSPSWRTIMAYNCPNGCPRLNYWSNPAKLFNGVPMGTAAQNDNARVLNNTRGTVAAFR